MCASLQLTFRQTIGKAAVSTDELASQLTARIIKRVTWWETLIALILLCIALVIAQHVGLR